MNIWYHLANESFEEQFCVNKNKPEKGCHGSCMIKKINQAPKEKDELTRFALNIQFHLSSFLYCPPFPDFNEGTLIKQKKTMLYLFSYLFLKLTRCFHPPEMKIPIAIA